MKKKTGVYEWAAASVNCSICCKNDCAYCVDQDTLILLSNGTWKKIKYLTIGEEIVGFSENEHRYQKSKVENIWQTLKPAYEITLKNGMQVICSGEHRWLTNRGWKYTIGKEIGCERRPFLTTNNLISFLTKPIESQVETEDYILGYLSGMIRGDASLGHYTYKNLKGISNIYSFRLALNDIEGIDRVKRFLSSIKINTFSFDFKNKEKLMPAIRTSKKDDFIKICKIIEYKDTKEFGRGFVSGIFDAEGSGGSPSAVIRIYNTDLSILQFTEKILRTFNFRTIFDAPRKNGCLSLRIRGGLPEVARFFSIFNPAITRKFRFENIRHAYGGSQIESIKFLNEERIMYDLTTSSKTFIANGMLAHNCYGRRISLNNGFISNNEEWRTLNKEKRNIKKEKTLYNGTVMFPSMHDIHEENLDLCLDVLNNLLSAGNKVLITSKPKFPCIEKICSTFQDYKENILFRFSIGTLDEKIIHLWEPGASTVYERLRCLNYCFERGFNTSVSMEPMLDSSSVIGDFFLLEKYVTDSIWIGLMNKIDQRVINIPADEMQRIKDGQSFAIIENIHTSLKYQPKVKWKDSISELLNLEGSINV